MSRKRKTTEAAEPTQEAIVTSEEMQATQEPEIISTPEVGEIAQEAIQEATPTQEPQEPNDVLIVGLQEDGASAEQATTPTQAVMATHAGQALEKSTRKQAPTRYLPEIAKLSSSSQMVFSNLLTYIQDADLRNPMHEVTMGKLQARLFNVYRGIFENNPQDFDLAFGILLAIVKEHSQGVFSLLAINRGVSQFQGSNVERQAFERFNCLVTSLADAPTYKDALKSISLPWIFSIKYAAGVDTESIKEKVYAWINR